MLDWRVKCTILGVNKNLVKKITEESNKSMPFTKKIQEKKQNTAFMYVTLELDSMNIEQITFYSLVFFLV